MPKKTQEFFLRFFLYFKFFLSCFFKIRRKTPGKIKTKSRKEMTIADGSSKIPAKGFIRYKNMANGVVGSFAIITTA